MTATISSARRSRQGASAAIVNESFHAAHGGKNLIVVPDTLKALEALGQAARARSRAEIIAVTGSAGKTTTKEAIRTVLSAVGEHACLYQELQQSLGRAADAGAAAARGAVRRVRDRHEPCGRDHAAGEARAPPYCGRHHGRRGAPPVLRLGRRHRRREGRDLPGLEPGGTALLNADHDYLHILFNHARKAGVGRIVTYGFDDSADWRITDIETLPTRTIAQVVHEGETLGLSLPVPGRHMAANAVAALAVAHLCGEGTTTALHALARFGAAEGRGETTLLGSGDKPLLLVDESYNANPASMAAALDVYAQVKPPGGGAKVLVLGDMLELGVQSPALHAKLKDAAVASGATRIFLVGESMGALAEALAGEPIAGHAKSVEELTETILAGLAPGDSVMVKGSKGVRLAGLVQAIRDRFR
jgi:UDP-N-acetylmuramoyl-tripeptide--D-alanyl-D-alanine ligase